MAVPRPMLDEASSGSSESTSCVQGRHGRATGEHRTRFGLENCEIMVCRSNEQICRSKCAARRYARPAPSHERTPKTSRIHKPRIGMAGAAVSISAAAQIGPEMEIHAQGEALTQDVRGLERGLC